MIYFSEEEILNKLLNAEGHIYIYGAGFFASVCFDFLQAINKTISGFITSTRTIENYRGQKVYTAEAAKGILNSKDIVILAVKGLKENDIISSFTDEVPVIMETEMDLLWWLRKKHCLKPIVETLYQKNKLEEKKLSLESVKRILLIRLDVLGDLICSIPAIREIKCNAPQAEITLIVQRQYERVVRECPYVDRLILYEAQGEVEYTISSMVKLCEHVEKFAEKELKKEEYDLVVLLTEAMEGGNAEEALFLSLSVKSAFRLGHQVNRQFRSMHNVKFVQNYFTSLSVREEGLHEADYMLNMLEDIGCKIANRQLELFVSSCAESKIESFIRSRKLQNKKLIAVGVVGSSLEKNWNISNYKELFNLFNEKYGNDYLFVLFGGKEAVETVAEIDEGNVVNLVGKLQLDESIALMSRCMLYIGSNTGVLHMAGAFQLPSIVFYKILSDADLNVSDGPVRWGVREAEHVALIPPTGLDGCHLVCRKDYSHCINQITVGMALEQLERMVNQRKECV